ncbi:MAG: 3-beta hydroxysteroid dehydrogenase [Rhodospirillaceae bacterium]|nr:3-beta hydroxysteroid dehydrogenase [Rhodospirillaceae bacterium]|tara:strand:+ start:5339 stop:6097 length:759 start_codon:yes stop_codon:yes gene_type:complete
MNGRLRNKVALITGGASGFGRQSAIRMVEEGALVCVTDLNLEGAEETAAMLGKRGFALQQDVTSADVWDDTVRKVLDRYGKLDVLVNCAGIGVEGDNIDECDDRIWDAVMDANLHGTHLGCRAVMEPMKRAGGGSIINLASVLGLRGEAYALAYCASKGAVRLLTKSIAVHCGEQRNNIRCNAICPGYMLTPMVHRFTSEIGPEETQRITSMHPLGRMGDSDDIAHMAVYLASDESKFVTGAEMVVDGGYTA